jgi:WD40 repeat protein
MLPISHLAFACSLLAPVDVNGNPLPPGAIARLGGERLAHTSGGAVAFSSDGKTLVGDGDPLQFWDAATGRRAAGIEPGATVRGLTEVAPDLSSAADRGGSTIVLRDPLSRKKLHSLKGPSVIADCVAYSPDGKTLAVGWRKKVVQFCDVATGKEVSTLELPGDPQYLAYLPDGKALLSATRRDKERECTLWDLESGKPLRTWKGWHGPVVLSPDGKRLLTGGENGRLHVWDVGTGEELRSFATHHHEHIGQHDAARRSAVFSADGKLLAAAAVTDRVHVWDLKTGEELHCSLPFLYRVRSLAFSPDGKTLAVGTEDRVRLVDAATGKDRLPPAAHANPVYGGWVSPDGETVVTRSKEGSYRWDAATGKELDRWPDKRFRGFTPDGDHLWQEGGQVVQTNAGTGKEVRRLKVYERKVQDEFDGISVCYSRDGKTVATGSDDRTVRLWDAATGELVWKAKRANKDRRFPADLGSHHPLGFTHDGKGVVTYAHDAVVRVYDAKSGEELRWFRIDARDAYLSPDGKHLIATDKHEAAPNGTSEGYESSPMRLWDMTKDEPEAIEFHPSERVNKVAISPDSKRVALAIDSDVVLVDLATRKELRRLTGHSGRVWGLTFSPDGKRLVSGSDDRTALVWDVR